MTALAGVIHLWIIPEHWEHSPAHALFFLLVQKIIMDAEDDPPQQKQN